jgi:outer membrane protein OmpA-like peptidoglycan-associated protein
MFSLSTRSFNELKTSGNTRHRYIEIAYAWRTIAQPMKEDTDGTLHAERADREPYKVIVNDRLVDLPTIVGVANRGNPKQTVAKILDDERFPLVLDYEVPGDGFRIQFAKISFPTGGELEKHLAVEKHVDVYGIYFDFASDRLRPESTPVLSEIAGALANNAGWTLSINGHTDNIGGESSNLDLSRRRSESVRRALVEQYRIDSARLVTAGFGASQPKESNATVEGRGKNRRVELVRQ